MFISEATAIVNNTSVACAPEGSRMDSPLLRTVFLVFNRIHQVWWWHRRKEVYSNPDNFLKLMSGQTVNWFAGNSLLVRIAAQTVLISTRIVECIEEQVKLCREAERLWEGVAGTEAFLPPKVKWIKQQQSTFFSPSTRTYWMRVSAETKARMWRIFCSSLLIAKRIFILSMHTMDAIGAFSYNAATRHEAVGEFFVNCSKWTHLLTDNKRIMLNALKNNRVVITNVLKGLHTPLTVEQLITSMEHIVSVAEKMNKQVDGVSETVGIFAKDFFQRSMFGLCQTFGLAKYMPRSWVPPLRPPWIVAMNR